MSNIEVDQMAGRAGRIEFAEFGEAVVISNSEQAQKYYKREFEITSCLDSHLLKAIN